MKVKEKFGLALIALAMGMSVVSCDDEPKGIGGSSGNGKDDEEIIQPEAENVYDDYVSPSTPGIKAVDLSLGVKWGDRNVGAKSVSDYGGYYVWADPSGKALKFGYDNFALSDISGTKYDIATMNLGEGWRMPTGDEIQEMLNGCKNIAATIDGVDGVKMIASNGEYIFLPFAGYRYLEYVGFGEGMIGYFWTGDGYDDENLYAPYLWCGTRMDLSDKYNVDYGISVRPVFDGD